MKTPRTPLAILVLAGAAVAQEHAGKTTLRRFFGPVSSVEVDLDSGAITRGASVRPRSASTAVTFANLDLGGFVAADTGSCACEWYDAGFKSGGRSTFVSGLVFAYCSAALDPLSGGPGGVTEISFRSGYTLGANGVGQPPNGTEVVRILLTGLPANTACSSFFGGFRCFFMTVRFDTTFCLADGAIGYGWKFVDLGTPGRLAKTFPFLSCIQSCSGGPGPDGQGMVSLQDQYCPPGTLLSTFSFCSCCCFGGYFDSMSMQIRELDSTGALPSAVFATSNAAILADNAGSLGFGPNLGDPVERFGVSLDCSTATTGGVWRIQLRPGLIPAGVTTGLGLLAASGPVLHAFGGMHAQDVVATPTIRLPKTISFACLAYTSQGWCQSSPRGFLSNALRETIGVP